MICELNITVMLQFSFKLIVDLLMGGDMERASLALVWSEDEIEDTKPPGYESLVFTGQSDALASYLSFSNGHNPHGKLRPGDLPTLSMLC